jgi:hypothetical protein
MVEFSNLGLLENQSIIKVNVSSIQSVTDNLPNSGTLSSIGTLSNQSLILVDGDNLIGNTSSLIGSNSTIDTVVDEIKTITDVLPDSGALTSLGTRINQTFFLIEGEHLSYVFPENTGYTVTLHTGATNAYGPYTMILDDQNNTFSDKFNNTEGHMSSILIEEASVADKTFQFEISYGAGHTPIIEYRFHSATNQVGPTSQTRIRPLSNPAGESLYYRGMCENASATVEVSFRYHFHS